MKGLLGRVSDRWRKPPAPEPDAASAATALVESGLAHHRAGRLQDAEAAYRASLARDPSAFDALHMLGAVCQQTGRLDEAYVLLERASTARPGHAVVHASLALIEQARGQLDRALESIGRALALDPRFDDAHNIRGVLLQQRGDSAGARAAFQRAVDANPGNASALNNLANAAADAGDVTGAESLYRRALALQPRSPQILVHLGSVLRRLRRHDEAEACLREALAIAPDDPDALNDLGALLQSAGRLADAEDAFRAALCGNPGLVEAHANLASVLVERGDADAASHEVDTALALRPDDGEALNVRALIQQKTGDLAGAEATCRRALALHPARASLHNTLGTILNALGDADGALAQFERAVESDAGSATARYNLGVACLIRGRYPQGFCLYESRFQAFPAQYESLRSLHPLLEPARTWHGASLVGRRILVWAEQGYGDTLMMLRYMPLLKAGGAAQVAVLCDERLARFAASCAGVDLVFASGDELQGHDVDLHRAMMSLPAALGTTLDSVPPPAAVAIDPNLLALWHSRVRIDHRPRVGIAWSGSATLRDDARRSVPFGTFARLLDDPGVQFVSLQKERPAGAAPPHPRLADWMDDCRDFMDTAALIANLDLVISVDTAVAHLAATLGRPTWLLNRYGSEWRWGLHSSDSPWYPSLRQFRQAAPGAWDDVIAQLKRELALTRFSTPDQRP
jgi:tetratricopeptide (TPR) repeat protein